MNAKSATTELTTRESLDFLVGQPFGRLAVVLNNKPDIFPINFACYVDENDKAIAYIKTSPGTKLFATVSGFPVALEADEVSEGAATSVIAYGYGRLVQHRHEFERVKALGQDAWVAEQKADVVAIDIDKVSGRSFRLGPAPEGIKLFPVD